MASNYVLICAGARGRSETDIREAAELGKALGLHGYSVMTGGGYGLMNIVADACMQSGGSAIGLTLTSIAGRRSPPTTHIVYQRDSLFERKQEMLNTCRKAIVIPGGVGTLDEFFEMLCAKKLGHWNGEIVLYNLRGYYDGMLEQLEQCRFDGYLQGVPLFHIANDVAGAIAALSPSSKFEDHDE